MSNEFDYPIFTKEMVKDYTILIPGMLDLHMKMFKNVIEASGYKCKVCTNEAHAIDEGIKYVHNDTCYPATLVIGQFIDALNQMEDTSKVALIITQTGGGCRASNYVHLLRKALIKAGYGHVPCIAISMGNIENCGFQINYKMVTRLAAAVFYGDILMYLKNKCMPYEVNKGETLKLVDDWCDKLSKILTSGHGTSKRDLKKYFNLISKSFDEIKVNIVPKVKVGIVGEIYVKYARLGNNNLEEFLASEDCEVNLPGLLGFVNYSLYVPLYDKELYGGSFIKAAIYKFLIRFCARREKMMIDAIKTTKFEPMKPFSHTVNLSNGTLSHGVKMGEGFLLTAEMIELCETGYENIVCVQPFGCLPNHICGKGVMKKIKAEHPEANIVAVDYDPSATKVNQENRIKLMLAIARERLNSKN